MSRFAEFEASLLGMLVDKCNADRECLAKLVGLKDLHGRALVARVLEMKLADEFRLARLISQYWELSLVTVTAPYRPFLIHFSRPVRDLLDLELLPYEFGDGEFTVVSYYVPSEDAVKALEQAHGARMKIAIGERSAVKDALARLAEEVTRFEAAEPVDCGADKELFARVTAEGWPALVREPMAGGFVLIEFGRDRRLTKTVESLDPSEPDVVRQLLLGKSMSTVVPLGGDVRKLAGDFVDTVGHFDGELAEAILKLRVAQMIFEAEGKE